MLPFSLEKLETISFGQRGNRSTCNKLSPDLLEAAFKIRILKEAIHKFMKWATVENFLPTACLFCRPWGGCLELLVTEYPGLWLKMGLALSKNQCFYVQTWRVNRKDLEFKQTHGVVNERGINLLAESKALVAT